MDHQGHSKVGFFYLDILLLPTVYSSTDKSFSGAIMTNDNSKRYWGLNGNNVGEL